MVTAKRTAMPKNQEAYGFNNCGVYQHQFGTNNCGVYQHQFGTQRGDNYRLYVICCIEIMCLVDCHHHGAYGAKKIHAEELISASLLGC